MKENRRKVGAYGELLAEKYLNRKGYVLIEKNRTFVGSEIDLVCRQNEWLVFVEVKYRRGKSYGDIHDSINLNKLKTLRRGINRFLVESGQLGFPWRIDAVLIQKTSPDLVIEHYEDILAL